MEGQINTALWFSPGVRLDQATMAARAAAICISVMIVQRAVSLPRPALEAVATTMARARQAWAP